MNAQEIVVFALKGSIMLTVFVFGLKATITDLLYVLQRPRLLVRSLTAMFVIMPLFASFVARKGHFDLAAAIALVAVSLSPVPPLLPRKMTKGGGIPPYGLGIVGHGGSARDFVYPTGNRLDRQIFDKPLATSPGAVAKVVLGFILIPLVAGTVVRRNAPAFASRIAHPIALIAGIVLLVGAACILAFASRSALEPIGDGTLIVFAGFVLAGLLVGHFLGGPDPESRVVLALSTACRHPALALAIASANFPGSTAWWLRFFCISCSVFC